MTDFALSFTDDRRTDRDGRRQFFLDWEGSRGHRGQIFFANPAEVVQRIWAEGGSITIAVPDEPP